MPKSEPLHRHATSRPLLSLPRFQFSLAWLLIVVTIVAVAAGLGDRRSARLRRRSLLLYLIVCCVVPTPLVICAIFGRGDVQAFAIGALDPVGNDHRPADPIRWLIDRTCDYGYG